MPTGRVRSLMKNHRIHPESPLHPQQLRMKRIISQTGELYWKLRDEPTPKHRKQYERAVNDFAKLLLDMRRNKNGLT